MRLRTLYLVSGIAVGSVLGLVGCFVILQLSLVAAFFAMDNASLSRVVGSTANVLVVMALITALGVSARFGWIWGVRAENRPIESEGNAAKQRGVLWTILIGSLVIDFSAVAAVVILEARSSAEARQWKATMSSADAFLKSQYRLDTLYVRKTKEGDVDTIFVGMHGSLAGTYRLGVNWFSTMPRGDIVEFAENLVMPANRSFRQGLVFRYAQLESSFAHLMDSTSGGNPAGYLVDQGIMVEARLRPVGFEQLHTGLAGRTTLSSRVIEVPIQFERQGMPPPGGEDGSRKRP